MDKKLGFIGCGNMSSAMIKGLILSKIVSPDCIKASDISIRKLDRMKDDLHILTTNNNKEVAEFADILVLAVKPKIYGQIISEIKDTVKDDVIVVTIAAGITMQTVKKQFGKNIKVVRAMPNIPAIIGKGMSSLSFNEHVLEEELNCVYKMFNGFGEVEIIDEKLMNVVTAVGSSSPALVYMFIQSLADGGVLNGLSRDVSYKMAAQAVLGAAKMVLETGEHPGELKDEVCSPGGTAIEAVYCLEREGFRRSIIEAINRCTKKSEKLGKEKNGKQES